MCFRSLRFLLRFSVIIFLATGSAMASDEKADVQTKVSIGGYAFWQFGQIVQGYDREAGDISNQWMNSVLLGMSLSARPSERLKLVISPEFYLNYPYPQERNNPSSMRPFGIAYVNEADGIFSFGDMEQPFLQASLGMFTFKYNPDSRNLGDYLFRTGTYPTYMITNFDFPAARLLGLHLSSNPVTNLHVDFLLTSEAYMFPLYDFSLTGIASYKIFNAIELGLGIDFARCLPVMDSLTSPKNLKSQNAVSYNSYVTQDNDTAFYSFKATKIMARASIDFKPFLGSPDFLGPEDLKLYGEICWVGVGGYNAQDLPDSGYRAWYNDLNKRTPRMFGFNVPTFKLLNVLAAEVEYFPSELPNDYTTQDRQQSPMPYLSGGYNSYNADDWNKGFWRWSFYGKKLVVRGFSITGQVAFDHLRTTFWDGSTNEYECMIKKGDWHWDLKFGYSF